MELINKRTYNAKHIDNGDGTFTMDAHAGHIHYKDDNGVLQDSDFTPVDQGAYYEMSKHSYQLRVAKDFAAPLLMQYRNTFEGADHTITYEPFAIAWYNNATNDVQIFRNQQSVQAVYKQETNSFYYTDAFGAGVDFEITIQRSGFKKEVVIPVKPNVFPTSPGAGYRMVALFKYGGTGLNVIDEETKTIWNSIAHIEGGKGFELKETNSFVKSSSFIRPAYGVDGDGRTMPLRVMWRKRNNQLWQIKEIPLDTMEQATFPVRFDTVTSYYAGSGDGYILGYTNTSPGTLAAWDSVHDSTSPALNAVSTTTSTEDDTGGRLQSRVAANGTQISRQFFPVDTSGIGSGNTVTAATFYLYYGVTVFANDFALALVQTSQPSNTALTAADFDLCGDAINNPTEGASRNSYTSTNTVQYRTFALDATGLSWIDKTGFTKLGIRTDKDCDDSYATYGDNRWATRYSEYTGTGSDPYLEVTYTAGVLDTTNFFAYF